jgi:DNA repair exonuclease SbcCD ATPase subunit
MQDTKINEDLIAGLKAKIKQLRADKDLFVKAQGMAQEAERLRGEAEKQRSDVKLLKDSNSSLISKKNEAVSKSLDGIVNKMKEVLTEGTPVITVSDGSNVFIGWEKEGKQPVSYSGLSGGEKVQYDAALCYALKANIIISEFAELDDERLPLALAKFKDMDVQVICSSCHDVRNVPKEFQVVVL